MKILFLAHRTPWPPMKGFQVRPYHMMRALKAAGHDVDLMCFAHDAEDLKGQAPLEKLCRSVFLAPSSLWAKALHSGFAVLLGKPISYGYFFTQGFKNKVDAYLAQEKPDAIVMYSSSMAQYIPPQWRARTFAEMADVDSQKWAEMATRGSAPMTWIYGMEARRLFAIEQDIARTCGAVSLAAARELGVYEKLDPGAHLQKFHVITNGADISAFKPQRRADVAVEKLPEGERKWFTSGDAPTLLFTGAMDYAPNIEGVSFFAKEVMPKIRAVHKDARFLIVGSKPSAEVQALGQLPGVGVTGFVDKVQPYFAISDVYVTPLLLARGVQNKVIEAMACGAAIVLTPAAHEGIAAQPGRDYVLAANAEAFAQECLALLADAPRRAALGTAARAFVEQNLDWDALMARFVAEVEKLARA